ncbi:MAG: NAD(P)/FAD-dependent oxidoreductase, partial [Chloroflexota bacterium]
AQLRASDELIDELSYREEVTIHYSSKIKEIRGENQVEAIDVIVQGEPKTLTAAGVFIYLQGNVPIIDFLGDEVATTDDGCLVVDDTFQTNLGGVFAVGDVLCKHVKQAVIAAAEGVEAAIAVDRHLHGRDQLRPDWSH